MTDLPTVITAAGLQVTAPATLRANTVTYTETASPGITTDLPGTLIEDLASTTTGALVQIDQARVDAVNSVTPYGCNVALLDQMGKIYGITRGTATNTSAYVTFTGTPGMYINVGFTVSDGTYTYTTQDAATIASDGSSGSVYVIATTSGSWAVPAGSITSVTTSVPTGYTLTVTNAATGTPGADAETDSSFRSRIISSAAVSCQSTPRLIKSNVGNVSGVNSRLISVATTTSGLRIMVGGGDPYEVAGAIYTSVADIDSLVGSVNTITGATQASPCVITTELTHGLTDGESVTISGALGMTEINGTYAATVISGTTFSIAVDTTSASAYTGSGVLETNPRNETINITDYPDSYPITFVTPLQQVVRIVLVWNTLTTNTVSEASVSSLGVSALVTYINGIYAGAPINLYQMESAFSTAIEDIVSGNDLTRMEFTVYIDDVEVTPETGTGIIQGDTQSYLYTTSSYISITRG